MQGQEHRDNRIRPYTVVRNHNLNSSGKLTEPIDEASDKGETSTSKSERVRRRCTDTDVLEKVRAVVGKADTREDLTGEDNTGDFSSPELKALKTVLIAGTHRELFFKIISVDDRCEGPHRIDVCGLRALKTAEGFLRLLQAVHSNEVPGAFGSEVDQWDQETRPDPLQGKWDSVAPLIDTSRQALEHTG